MYQLTIQDYNSYKFLANLSALYALFAKFCSGACIDGA